MPTCRFCGALNPADAQACQKCGGPMAEPASPPAWPSEVTQQDAELLELLKAGRKIDAIKHHRSATGMGLKEAKDYVEALAARHGIPQAKGCGAAALVLVGLAAATTAGLAVLLG